MKKIFSIILVATLLMSMTSYAVTTDASAFVDNQASIVESSDYVRYDFESGATSYHSFYEVPNAIGDADYAISPGYFPNGTEYNDGNLASPAAIVGSADNRVHITNTTVGPYCNTVYIYAQYTHNGVSYRGIGSGFVIGPSAVATAAHCVYHATYGIADSIYIVPAKNGTLEPYGRETIDDPVIGENVIISTDYLQSGSSADDWAVIELDSQVGNQTGWLGIRWQSASYNNTYVYNTGYPAEVTGYEQDDVDRDMFLGTGYVRYSAAKYLCGDWDATGGNSGGPVYIYNSDTGYTLIGILTAGSGTDTDFNDYGLGDGEAYTYATRITQDIYNLFVSYRPTS